MTGRRDFGTVRLLGTGRYQARYVDRSGRRHARSFATKGDATRFLSGARVDLDRGDWVDPKAGQLTFEAYASTWLAERRVKGRPISPRTRERYASLLQVRINPALGKIQLRFLEPADVRRWHAVLLATEGVGPSTVAKAYRLVHAVCASAVAEEELVRNPCAIPGASAESHEERPVATVSQVYAIADQLGDRWRTLVLTATFCGLRFGELAGLTVERVDLLHRTITVAVDLDELDGGHLQVGRVKSEASRRVVTVPNVIVPELERHLGTHSGTGPTGYVFVGPQGGLLRRSNFRDRWVKAVTAVGLPDLRFHDLRHTGNTLAAATGASTRELMLRMGHASPRAAQIYQHATRERDAEIAASLSQMVQQWQDTANSSGG